METILYLSPRWAALWAASRHHRQGSSATAAKNMYLRGIRSRSMPTSAAFSWNLSDSSKSFRWQGISRRNERVHLYRVDRPYCSMHSHWWWNDHKNKSTASNIACYPAGNHGPPSSPPTVGGTAGTFRPNICGTKRARDYKQEDAMRNIRTKRNPLVFLECGAIPCDLFSYQPSKHPANTRKRHRRHKTSPKRVVDPPCLISFGPTKATLSEDHDNRQARIQETPKETSLCDSDDDGDDTHRVSHCPTTLTFEGKDGRLVTRAGYYSGPLVHGKMQGDGVFWFDDGSLYVGHFEGNHLEGMGALSIAHRRRQKVLTKPSHHKVYHGIFHDNVLVESCSAHHHHRHHHHHHKSSVQKTHAGGHHA